MVVVAVGHWPMRWAAGSSSSHSSTARRPNLSCSCRRRRSDFGVDHSWTLVVRGGRSTAISRPSGPLKARLSMSKSLGSPVQEGCLGEKLAPHDAAEVQEETTSPLTRRGQRTLWLLGYCVSLDAFRRTAWARSGAPSSTDMLRLPSCKPRPLQMLYDQWPRRDRSEQSAG